MAASSQRVLLEMSAAIDRVLAELESIPSLKDEQKAALEAFLGGKDVFALLSTHFVKRESTH